MPLRAYQYLTQILITGETELDIANLGEDTIVLAREATLANTNTTPELGEVLLAQSSLPSILKPIKHQAKFKNLHLIIRLPGAEPSPGTLATDAG